MVTRESTHSHHVTLHLSGYFGGGIPRPAERRAVPQRGCAWPPSSSGHTREQRQVDGGGEHKDEGSERKETIRCHSPNKPLLSVGSARGFVILF